MPKNVKWMEGIVSSVQKISDTKLILTTQLELDDIFQFEPGQFITMDLPLGEKRRQRWRSYSIGNIPNDDNILEFAIGHLDYGLASQYFFEKINIGDKIKFKGPEGAFVLPSNLNRPIIMIATGTGVVPFISMLRAISKNKTSFTNIHLIYGSRYERDILYREELIEMQSLFANFKVDFVLSREPAYEGFKGRVHDVYKSAYKNQSEEALFLLCGWTAMIDEAMANIFPLVATPAKQIKYELYG